MILFFSYFFIIHFHFVNPIPKKTHCFNMSFSLHFGVVWAVVLSSQCNDNSNFLEFFKFGKKHFVTAYYRQYSHIEMKSIDRRHIRFPIFYFNKRYSIIHYCGNQRFVVVGRIRLNICKIILTLEVLNLRRVELSYTKTHNYN